MQKMMTKTLARQLPKLYETDGQGNDAIARGHWFAPNADWFATEYDEATGDCFGLVHFFGFEPELGYFNVNEFEQMNKRPWHLVNGEMRFWLVERDLHWEPRTIGECREY